MFREIQSCRICGNEELDSILNLGTQYLTGVFPRTAKADLTRGPLELVRCQSRQDRESCGLVQLHHSYEPSEMYGDNYGYRSSLNRAMVEHIKTIVSYLLELVSLQPGDIALDIGSNDGTLLSFYPPDGPDLVGVDPAEKFKKFYQPHIQLITGFFSSEIFRKHYGSRKAKIITSIAMFYDLERPLEFMKQISEILADDGVWHFEQSYLPSMLSANAYDTICHEHLSYYSMQQIRYMANRAGLKILNVSLNSVNGGSFAVTAAKRESSFPGAAGEVDQMIQSEHEAGLRFTTIYDKFRQRVLAHRDHLVALIRKLNGEGRLILGYGASTKGNVVLQFCGITPKEIPYIAEVNEEKFGCFTPGSGIPIISEQDAKALDPNFFLVQPWHFREGILRRERRFLENGGRMIFPLPEIEIT